MSSTDCVAKRLNGSYREHYIKVGQVLEQLKKEIKAELNDKQRAVYEAHEQRTGS